ncbi:MAG TPA: hypothetical protein VGC31_04675 [Paenirhodobacter sp.]
MRSDMLMPIIRPFLVLVLSLAIAVTGLGLGVARGQIRLDGQIVLCTGEGMITYERGPDGKATGAAHICPDMALMLFSSASGAAMIPLTAALRTSSALFARPATRAAGLAPHSPSARDPPHLS